MLPEIVISASSEAMLRAECTAAPLLLTLDVHTDYFDAALTGTTKSKPSKVPLAGPSLDDSIRTYKPFPW